MCLEPVFAKQRWFFFVGCVTCNRGFSWLGMSLVTAFSLVRYFASASSCSSFGIAPARVARKFDD